LDAASIPAWEELEIEEVHAVRGLLVEKRAAPSCLLCHAAWRSRTPSSDETESRLSTSSDQRRRAIRTSSRSAFSDEYTSSRPGSQMSQLSQVSQLLQVSLPTHRPRRKKTRRWRSWLAVAKVEPVVNLL